MKTITQLVKRLTEQNEKYGEVIQAPAEAERIDQVQTYIKRKWVVQIPDAYRELLLLTNGIDNDGVIIYATHKSLIASYEDRYIGGIIETNEE